MSEEYKLNTNEEDEIMIGLSDIEKELMTSIQDLSRKFMEHNIPCFLTGKFSNNDDLISAWHLGNTKEEAFHAFITHLAPLFLHMTSEVTNTNIEAVHRETGKVVFNTNPDSQHQQTDES